MVGRAQRHAVVDDVGAVGLVPANMGGVEADRLGAETDVGVGVGNNATRLRASLYGSKPSNKGCVVEMEFTIKLPDNRSITEFVAGIGDSEAQAISDAQLNFMLTTFHVVYKGFINDADPHMTSRSAASNAP